MARTGQIYVLADSRKIGCAPFMAWAPLERPWTLVTDSLATDQQLGPFRAKNNVSVVLVTASTAELSPPAISKLSVNR